MSRAKVQVVIHDNGGGWDGRPMPGIDLSVKPFFGYVLGSPGVRASGRTEKEVLERIRDLLVMKMDEGGNVTRKIVELDLGDHMTVDDVMNG